MLDREYDIYFASDAAEARDALIRSLRIAEMLDPESYGSAHTMWLVYARLHTLEHRGENAAKATIYYQHAKYWFMRRMEVQGMMTEDIAKELDEYTPLRNLEIIDKWDNAARQMSKPETGAYP